MKILSRATIGVVVLLLAGTGLRAQGVEQDILIAEKILETLLYEDRSSGIFIGNSINGEYVENYGVIFSFPTSKFSYIHYGDGGQNIVVTGRASTATTIVEGYPLERREKSKARNSSEEVDVDSISTAFKEKLIAVSKTFITDYGKLMGGLKDNERIMISERARANSGWINVYGSGSQSAKNSSKLAIEVKMSDIRAYDTGKISKEQLLGRIEITENDPKELLSPDLELFSSILGRLYGRDLSTSYYATGDPQYERIANMGAVYNFRVYSSIRENANYRMPTINEEKLTKRERDEKVVELYPKFLDGMKKNMVEYGRTITSLDSDEVLIFKIRLTECEDCDIPKSIDLSIKASVLKSFDARKIDLNKAVGSIKLKEYPQ